MPFAAYGRSFRLYAANGLCGLHDQWSVSLRGQGAPSATSP